MPSWGPDKDGKVHDLRVGGCDCLMCSFIRRNWFGPTGDPEWYKDPDKTKQTQDRVKEKFKSG